MIVLSKHFLSLGLVALLGSLSVQQAVFAQALVPRTLELDSTKLEQAGLAVAQDALQLIQFQQLNEALARAKLATQLAPRAYETWALLGAVYLSLNKPSEGVSALERALSINRKNAGVYFSLGSAYFRQGRYQDAVKALEQGLALKPNSTDEIFSLGNAHLKLAQFPQAISQFRRAIALDKKFWPAINNIGLILYEQGDRAGAVRNWQEAITMDSKAGEPQMALAVALFMQGRTEQGLALAETALKIDSRYAEVSFLKENLWGDKLIADTRQVLAHPRIRSTLAQLQREAQTAAPQPQR
jgi:tetratricopeptide (TPR) repeat protein